MSRHKAAAKNPTSTRRRPSASVRVPDDRDEHSDPISTTRLRPECSQESSPRPRHNSTSGRARASMFVTSGGSVGGGGDTPASTVFGSTVRASEEGDQLRYYLASLVRMSDNIVAKAVRAFDRLFELDVKDQAEIHLQLGRELAEDGNVREAIQALRKAARLRPEDGAIRFQIGSIYLMRRKAPEAAHGEFVKARELGFDSAKLRIHSAEALMELGRGGEAVAELEAALGLDPESAEAFYMLGVALDDAGTFDRAVEAFRRAVELAPREIAYHQRLGFALESAGRRKDAIRCFKRALELERRQARDS